MARPKADRRRRSASMKTRTETKSRVKYHNYNTNDNSKKLKAALMQVCSSGNLRTTAERHSIPKSTLHEQFKKLKQNNNDFTIFGHNRTERRMLLSEDEEAAVEQYCLWQSDRGMNLNNNHVKALIREIHSRAVEAGEKRQQLNSSLGPSPKYMRAFYKRHPKLSSRSSERVDRGRINMANKDTVLEYFDLLKSSLVKDGIMELDEHGNPIQDSIKIDRIYLADETGWGVNTKAKKVIGRKGAKHIYNRKSNDESHKTLMLGICGNGDVLKTLIILEKSFPLLSEGEADHIPDNILLSKTEKGSMDHELFCEWLEKAVIPHKQQLNPDGISYIILDNHGSRFSTRSIDLCIANNIEMLCYPGHLTHILQGPDVVLNKPISTQVESMIYNNPVISGNSDLSRVAFIAIIDQAVKTVCTKENVFMAFSATGIIPFNPQRIDLTQFPSSFAGAVASDSPVKATCKECRASNVELHPLVKQGVIPKRIAEVFTYTPPPEKTKTKSKIVKTARIITSEEVRAEVMAVEQKKKEKGEKLMKVKLPVKGKRMKAGVREKQILKKLINKEKITSESEFSDSDDQSEGSVDDTSVMMVSSHSDNDLRKDTYVIVDYEKELFPGKITEILSHDYVQVSCMEKGGVRGSIWKWPKIKDEKPYPRCDIKQTNITLKLLPGTARRVEFHVPELDHIWGHPLMKIVL